MSEGKEVLPVQPSSAKDASLSHTTRCVYVMFAVKLKQEGIQIFCCRIKSVVVDLRSRRNALGMQMDFEP